MGRARPEPPRRRRQHREPQPRARPRRAAPPRSLKGAAGVRGAVPGCARSAPHPLCASCIEPALHPALHLLCASAPAPCIPHCSHCVQAATPCIYAALHQMVWILHRKPRSEQHPTPHCVCPCSTMLCTSCFAVCWPACTCAFCAHSSTEATLECFTAHCCPQHAQGSTLCSPAEAVGSIPAPRSATTTSVGNRH